MGATRNSINIGKSLNLISNLNITPAQTINNIPQEGPKQSAFKPHNSSTEGHKDEKLNTVSNINKELEGSPNNNTKRISEVKNEQKEPLKEL